MRNNASFEERNIATDPSARDELMKLGVNAVPVIIVDGQIMVGFNPGKLKAMIQPKP